jgi:hypothetical protein
LIEIASSVGWLEIAPGNKAMEVFQIGFTGCVLSYFGIDKRKAQPQKSLNSEDMEVRSCNKELIFKEKRYVVNEI